MALVMLAWCVGLISDSLSSLVNVPTRGETRLWRRSAGFFHEQRLIIEPKWCETPACHMLSCKSCLTKWIQTKSTRRKGSIFIDVFVWTLVDPMYMLSVCLLISWKPVFSGA